MPELTIEIGGRPFTVACQSGEEPYLEAAARMLDTEATVVLGQVGRMPEVRMLLMAGLMLADKTTGLEDDLRAAQAEVQQLRDALGEAEARLADRAQRLADLQEGRAAADAAAGATPGATPAAALPEGFEDRLAGLVEQAEALAARAAPAAGPNGKA